MMFTISEVECLGACVNAPMLQVNNEWFYEDLDEENVIELIEGFRSGKEMKVGPQNHRINSLGPEGRTSLFDMDEFKDKGRKINNVDFDAELKKLKEAESKKEKK